MPTATGALAGYYCTDSREKRPRLRLRAAFFPEGRIHDVPVLFPFLDKL